MCWAKARRWVGIRTAESCGRTFVLCRALQSRYGSGRHRMTWSLAAVYPSPVPLPKEGGQDKLLTVVQHRGFRESGVVWPGALTDAGHFECLRMASLLSANVRRRLIRQMNPDCSSADVFESSGGEELG